MARPQISTAGNEPGPALKKSPAKRASTKRRKSSAGRLRLLFSERVPSRISAIEPVVERLLKGLETSGWVDGQRSAIELAIREALANAVFHGNGSDERKRVALDCFEQGDGSVLLVVRDQGRGFDPASIADPTHPENVCRAGGRGIFLIHHFMDAVEFDRGGREIRMRKCK